MISIDSGDTLFFSARIKKNRIFHSQDQCQYAQWRKLQTTVWGDVQGTELTAISRRGNLQLLLVSQTVRLPKSRWKPLERSARLFFFFLAFKSKPKQNYPLMNNHFFPFKLWSLLH